jgi:hypothetical protein
MIGNASDQQILDIAWHPALQVVDVDTGVEHQLGTSLDLIRNEGQVIDMAAGECARHSSGLDPP